MKLALLNLGGRDRRQLFPDDAGPVDDTVHAPVNYHAYAACTGGGFYQAVNELPEDARQVLVLLRRDLRPALKAVEALAKDGRTMAIAFKEAGTHQVAAALHSRIQIDRFRELCRAAGAAIASTRELVSLYRNAGAEKVAFIPTPYPVDDNRWDFSAEEGRGIFIGTREFDVPSRNHLAALFAARTISEQTSEPVTVVNVGGRASRRMIESISFPQDRLTIVEGRRPYSEFLRLISRHRLVFQLDRSAVPGQVAGDALLCRLPCVGGDGAVERTAFPDLCGAGRDPVELAEIAVGLLNDPGAWHTAVARSQEAATAHLSFASCRQQLQTFFS